MRFVKLFFAMLLLLGCTSPEININRPSGEELYDNSIPLKVSGDVRVMQYNIHFGVGVDNRYDIDRLVKEIKKVNADIIILNEVDKHYSDRSNYMDMAEYIAGELKMNYVYDSSIRNPATTASGGNLREVGNAIITRYDISMIGTKFYSIGDTWPRVITKASLTLETGKKLVVAVSHFGLTQEGRIVQSKEALEWLKEDMDTPLLFCGDFNAIPDSQEIQYIYASLHESFGGKKNVYTFSTAKPASQIDYIFANDKVTFKQNATVIQSKTASDHFPIMVDFTL